MAFKKAEKSQSKLRLALTGPSGSGKTYSALAIASGLGARVAVIDTERGSASKYAHRFNFDVDELQSFHPDLYVAAIHEAEAAGYDVIVVDSLSHAWAGKGGILEIVDTASKKNSGARDSFSAWKMATPIQNRLMDTIVQARAHVICTMRSKTEWVLKENDHGKLAPKKIGMAPIQRDGLEFEFDVVGEMNVENEMVISKTRCELLSNQVITRPSAEVAKVLLGWLNEGRQADASSEVRRPNVDGLRTRIEAAQTVVGLKALGDEFQTLPAEVRDAVRPLYAARLDALSGAEPTAVANGAMAH